MVAGTGVCLTQECALACQHVYKSNVQLRAVLRNVQKETVMDITEHIQHVQLLLNVCLKSLL